MDAYSLDDLPFKLASVIKTDRFRISNLVKFTPSMKDHPEYSVETVEKLQKVPLKVELVFTIGTTGRNFATVINKDGERVLDVYVEDLSKI